MTQKTSDLHRDPSPKPARLLEATDDINKQAMSANPKSKIRRYPRSPGSGSQTFQALIISTIWNTLAETKFINSLRGKNQFNFPVKSQVNINMIYTIMS